MRPPTREEALLACALALLAGMLILAQYDIRAAQLLITEREAARDDIRRAEYAAAVLRGVHAADPGPGGSRVLGGHD